jgi:hypothetical protein
MTAAADNILPLDGMKGRDVEDVPPPSDRFIFNEPLSAAVVAAVLSVLGPRVAQEHEDLCRQITERFGADADEAADWSQLVREIQAKKRRSG